MAQADLSALSPARRAAMDRALTAAFGPSVVTSMSPVTGGMSGAALFRVGVDGDDYLLRLEPPGDAFRDPFRGHACMRIAAEASLAPRLRYTSADDGVAIMDFIGERPLGAARGGDRGALLFELGRLVGALHATPPFPTLMDYLDGLEALIGSLHRHGLLPPDDITPTLEAYGALATAYRRLAPDLVSSHNDINPRNVLYDGQRLWLVDWESAFLADRYVDLAAVIGFFARDAVEEHALLHAYFGAPATEAQQARLYLARQISHVFYGVMLLSAAAAERPAAGEPEGAGGPSLAEIHRALAANAFDLDSRAGRVAYGRARLRAVREGVADARFAWAVGAAR